MTPARAQTQTAWSGVQQPTLKVTVPLSIPTRSGSENPVLVHVRHVHVLVNRRQY